ncbi:protein kinase domain-containing protein [Streptomyces sp. NBC_00696]|uniref:protein kinase domain-containing protein n=1 Tax=Streptomyces sp. NBC_00696 TaxID=2903672 RepID=UPI002E368517|nr:protein kinase [Streptomyces sp. NBC_00696]
MPSDASIELRFAVGEKISDIYAILDQRDTDAMSGVTSKDPARPLGRGGSGTVYLASYRGMQLRALKFLTLNYLSGDTGQHATDFHAVFDRERVVLSTLAHGNIARLYDTDSYRDANGVEWKYIATDFIDGDELLPALKREDTTPDEVYNAISDVLRAVSYMHGKGVLHSDLKWENIKCRHSPTGIEAVLLDLGTAHYVTEEDAGPLQLTFDKASATTRVRFITTKRITHALHQQYRKKIVDKETLRQLFPYHDLHALGVLLDEIREDPDVAKKLQAVIGKDGLSALDIMSYNLRRSPEPEPKAHARDHKRVIQYSSVQQVYRDWRKLRRTYLAPVNVPELSLAAEFKYSVPTAAGRGVVTPRLSQLINHKLFQRLRRVPQLEMTLMKFPGATHTRFSHSLAMLRNTRYYLAHLLNDPKFRLLCEPADLEATILLALLHDVGHYQLSHMFEDYASAQRRAKHDDPWRVIDFDIPSDDDLLWCIVDPQRPSSLRGGYGGVVEQAWRASEERLGLTPAPAIAEIIRNDFSEATYEAMLRIHHAIYAPGDYTRATPAQLVLGSVLSSDVDADKVAYLIEDSLRSGVPYGSGVDFDGLLGALRMPDVHDIQGVPTLGITQKGLAAAQSIVVSRNLMVGQVYWQHTNRAATAMIKYAIARMLQRGVLSMPDFLGATLFLEYDATLNYLFEKFEKARDEWEVNPIANLLDGERRIYDTAFSTARLDRATSEQVGTVLTGKSFAGVINLESDLREIVRTVSDINDVADGEVLVDVPIKERERGSGDRGGQVLVYDSREDTKGTPLRTYTPFLQALKDQHIRENRICRVFVSPRISASDTFEAVVEALSQHIRQEYSD